MATHNKVTRSKKIAKPADPDADAISISEFCRKHGISLQSFYKFKTEMPATFTVGTRRLMFVRSRCALEGCA